MKILIILIFLAATTLALILIAFFAIAILAARTEVELDEF